MIIAPTLPHTSAPAAPDRTSTGAPARHEEPAPPTGPPRWLLPDATLIVLVAILAVAAAFAAYRANRHRLALDRLAADFTAGAAAYGKYLHEHRMPPANTDETGADGAGTSLLQGEGWTSPSPAGGFFRWVNAPVPGATGSRPLGGRIMLAAFPPAPEVALSPADLLELDRRIDDGNLATGRFRSGFNGWPVFLVNPAP